MAKPVLIIPVDGCISYKGVDYLPTSSPFPCEADEAARLIEMGVAAPFKVEKAPTPAQLAKAAAEEAAAAKADLLARNAAATTLEELGAICPAELPEEDIQAAVTAKMAELEAGAE